MSMIAHFRLVEPTVVEQLAGFDEDQMADFLFPEDEDGDTTEDIDKAWDGIGYLMNAATGGEVSTLLAGSEVGPDIGYGPARYLDPEEVRNTATVLARLEAQSLLEHYAPQDMLAAEVYPEIWDDTDGTQAYLAEHFTTVREMFLAGAKRGAALLAWLA